MREVCVISFSYFNPRPRKEGDTAFGNAVGGAIISIHALAKRATVHYKVLYKVDFHFNPRPRKEGD